MIAWICFVTHFWIVCKIMYYIGYNSMYDIYFVS